MREHVASGDCWCQPEKTDYSDARAAAIDAAEYCGCGEPDLHLDDGDGFDADYGDLIPSYIDQYGDYQGPDDEEYDPATGCYPGCPVCEEEYAEESEEYDGDPFGDPMYDTPLDAGDLCFFGEPGCDCAEYDVDVEIPQRGREFVITPEAEEVLKEMMYTPPAPEGYEYVLMPERPGGKSPGETGHYSDRNPEPIQVAEAWNLDPNEFNILKYMARWRSKGGIESLEKIKFYVDREIAMARREGIG